MKISPEELQRRLGSKSNLLNRLGNETSKSSETPAQVNPSPEIPSEKSKRGNDENNRLGAGRRTEIPNAPTSLRIVAGVLANAEGNAAQVARNLQLTSGQVRYAEKIETPEAKLTEKKVQEVALTRIMDAFGLLNPVTMAGEKPKDISSIAANLSRVYANLREKDSGTNNNLTVQIYAPSQRKLTDYETIEVQTGT